MKTILATFLTILMLFPVSAMGEVQTITHTAKQSFGGSQSADDALISAIAKAKRESLEMAGVYVEALTIVKDAKVDKDDILALTAGVLKTEIVSQKNYVSGDGFGIEIIVKIIVDPSILEGKVKKLLQDRTHLDQLDQLRKKEKELLDKMAILEKENRQLMAKKGSSKDLKKKFEAVTQELTAVDWYDKALTLWDNTVSNLHVSSFQTEIADGCKKPLEYLSTALKLKPDYSAAYLIRGKIYSAMGQESLAMKDYKKVVQLENPQNASGYARRGSAYNGLKDYQNALNDYDSAIQLNPGDPFNYSRRGFIYNDLKQYQLAIKDFDIVIRLTPDDWDAYEMRGLLYRALGLYQQAIQDFSEVIRLKPDRADIYISRGDSYYPLGLNQRAIEDYNQAILLRPTDSAYYVARGQAYSAQDQYHLAIQDFDQAIFLKPDNTNAYNARGFAYNLSGNMQGGCASFMRACELGDCRNYHSYKSKGRCR